MIYLKKNDKIIIVVAVVVIIIAAIGIATYVPSEDGNGDMIPTERMFTVTWDEMFGSMPMMSDFASKSAPYEDSVVINEENIKMITFNLSWVDDKATLLGRFGLDTLTLEITDPDGSVHEESAKSASRTRDGNVEIQIPVNSVKPSSVSIEAEDFAAAQELFDDDPAYHLEKWMNEEFQVKVYVSVGEIRILKKFMDKGNDFDLDITYTYWSGSLEEEEMPPESPSETSFDPWEEEGYPVYLSTLINSGCARFI